MHKKLGIIFIFFALKANTQEIKANLTVLAN